MKNYTWHIHIKGQVQGVGFRPFVYQKALALNLKGWVNNARNGVHIEFTADEETAYRFYRAMIEDRPSLSRITEQEIKKIPERYFDEFRIIHSEAEGPANLLLTPDFALCDHCREELFRETNRRAGYPFITCTLCGPRYSIIENLPYDRVTTSMKQFTLCSDCENEYGNPLDRRYYSQTNSCGECGITMSLYNSNPELLTSDTRQIIDKVTDLWKDEKIVAIKGIGGYLLTCDASSKKAIQALRNRKQRPAKPFALMYPNLQLLEHDMKLGEEEKEALTDATSPILLLNLRKNFHSTLCLEEIAPGLSQLGVMIPYTPLYALLMENFAHPVIATSGNISDSPIVFTNDKALEELTLIADFVVTNNRDIVVPQDDSVLTFSREHQQKIVVRRSRGLAPSYINRTLELPDKTVWASGAMLKSTFTYLHQQNIFISQYLGNLDYFDTTENYKHTAGHFFGLFDQQPELILSDRHSDYFSTRFAEHLANELGVPVQKYQHHIAHFAAILGEHNLLDTSEPILGVIWDGTGLGEDGNIWGGEFFIYENYSFSRYSHFDYFDFIAGDKMAREPRISALSACRDLERSNTLLRTKFTDYEWNNYRKLLAKSDTLKTSSVGRLFDAVASLLEIKDYARYEGEAAILLEEQAKRYINQHGPDCPGDYLPYSFEKKIPVKDLLGGIVEDLNNGVDKKEIAAKFHHTLAALIFKKAETLGIGKIAFSGGVFQNALLADLIFNYSEGRHELYFHQEFSPNDENISFGQLMCYLIECKKQENSREKDYA